MNEERAWVITRRGSYGAGRPLLYWSGNYWSTQNLEAIRFVRLLDAQRVIERTLSNEDARAEEHVWSDA